MTGTNQKTKLKNVFFLLPFLKSTHRKTCRWFDFDMRRRHCQVLHIAYSGFGLTQLQACGTHPLCKQEKITAAKQSSMSRHERGIVKNCKCPHCNSEALPRMGNARSTRKRRIVMDSKHQPHQ